MKLAMKAPLPAAPAADPSRPTRAVAGAVSPQRDRRSASSRCGTACARPRPSSPTSVGAPVRSAQSASSLQLALENEKLIDAQKAYINALKAAGESGDDIVGFVFAVNGELNSADVYPSNGLFRKMWAKLLTASAIEAIGHKNEPNVAPPSVEAVTAFLAAAEAGKANEKALNAGVRLETREADKAYLFETAARRRPTPAWVHRNYLAK